MWLNCEIQIDFVLNLPQIIQREDKGTGHLRAFGAVENIPFRFQLLILLGIFTLGLKLGQSVKSIPSRRRGKGQKWCVDVHPSCSLFSNKGIESLIFLFVFKVIKIK